MAQLEARGANQRIGFLGSLAANVVEGHEVGAAADDEVDGGSGVDLGACGNGLRDDLALGDGAGHFRRDEAEFEAVALKLVLRLGLREVLYVGNALLLDLRGDGRIVAGRAGVVPRAAVEGNDGHDDQRDENDDDGGNGDAGGLACVLGALETPVLALHGGTAIVGSGGALHARRAGGALLHDRHVGVGAHDVGLACRGKGARRSRAVAGNVDQIALDERVERVAQLVGGLETLGGVLTQQAHDDGLERGVEVGVDAARGHRLLVDLLESHAHGVVALEGKTAGGSLVHHDAQRVQVARGAEVLALGLLGGDVVGGAEHGVGLGEMGVLGACDAKVHDLGVAVGQNHDVLRLDVAVNDLMGVCDCQGGAYLGADLGDLLGCQRAMGADAAFEVGAAQVLHDDEVGARRLIAAPVIDLHDVGVLKCRRGARLLAEALCECGVTGVLGQHDLDGHLTVECGVDASVHRGHATGAHLRLHYVSVSKDCSVSDAGHSQRSHPSRCSTFIISSFRPKFRQPPEAHHLQVRWRCARHRSR